MIEQQKQTSQTAVKPETKSASKAPLLIAFLALLLAVAGAGGAGYLWLQMQQFQTSSVSDFSQLKSTIETQQALLQTAQEKIASTLDSSASLQTKSRALETRVQNIAEELSSVTGLNRIDWQISHAEHLVRAAHQRLILTSDIEGAYALLDAADKIMADINELGVIDVRRAMADDLITLSVSNKVDTVGLFEKIDALKAQIMQLSLPAQDFKAKEVTVKEMPANADLQTKIIVTMDNIWQRFNSQYEIQKLDEPIKPILSSEQRVYLKQNLNLLMEQAQLAVIKRDPVVYQRILQQAETWVTDHFRIDTPVGETVLETLAEMKTVELNPTAPDITATIRSLKIFASNWKKEKQIRQQGNANATEKAGSEKTPTAKEVSTNLGKSALQPEVPKV
ncbi:MAG TPA: uroporphyrinogen-III C-methyltransferase [Pseudomonadales bacterium]